MASDGRKTRYSDKEIERSRTDKQLMLEYRRNL